MKKIFNSLFSMQLTGILLLLFAVSIGYATFIENDFGAETAKAMVYNAGWFNVLLSILAVNLTGSIIIHKMYRKEKWAIFLFHISFLIIFIGAALTRFVGFEGTMSIREGDTSDEIISDKSYIDISASYNDQVVNISKQVFITPVSVKGIKKHFSIGGKDVTIEITDYFHNVAETWVDDPDGEKMVWVVASGKNNRRKDIYLTEEKPEVAGGKSFSLNANDSTADIRIFSDGNNNLNILSGDTLRLTNMSTGDIEMLPPGIVYPLQQMKLYGSGDLNFVIKKFYPGAVKKLTSTEGKSGMASLDAFIAQVRVGEKSDKIEVFGGKGFISKPSEITVDGVRVMLYFGAKKIKLPFSIKLNDFILERYPGSNSPSSYESEVTVIDKEKNIEMPYRIYMNHVLNYRGYRFFQSSYDSDEKGTVLSVNHDGLGTAVTYTGYLLMAIGMFAALFTRKSRFVYISRLSSKLHQTRKYATIFVILSVPVLYSPEKIIAKTSSEGQIPAISEEHCREFGNLLLQERDGRIKPVGSLASEVLRKIARKDKFNGQSPEQVFLGIMVYPDKWQNVRMIRVNHPGVQKVLGIEGKYAAFNEIVDFHNGGDYKLSEYVERAYAKKPAAQSKFDKEVLKVDERVNIFYMIYTGTFLRIFPVPGDENNKWVEASESKKYFSGDEEVFVRGILSLYFDAVREGVASGNFSKAGEYLNHIKSFQNKYGADVIPPESKIKMEILYNKINIFKRLSYYYGLVSFVLLIVFFISLLKPGMKLDKIIRAGSIAVIILFVVHSAGLAMRWYISGHAPWSDGYESMIYIGWATILAGLIFMKKSEITLTVTALLTSIILMVASMSWMDPEITNLVPVLKSYWLVIHVAIITASYGFLALGSLLGFFNLIMMNLKNGKNYKRLDLTITELSCIIEMTLIVGLYMLTIGTFIGGVWANESWGRYWGWDPKETWALVTVLVYAFVVHMRYIPGFKGNFAVSFAALISYGSVLMTYFGVNYYLSGLHSYAKGDPVQVPSSVFYTLIVLAVVSVMAFFSERKYSGQPVPGQEKD